MSETQGKSVTFTCKGVDHSMGFMMKCKNFVKCKSQADTVLEAAQTSRKLEV